MKEFETITHEVPMLSLANTYHRDEIMDFDRRVYEGLEGEEYRYVAELKFDGVPCRAPDKDTGCVQKQVQHQAEPPPSVITGVT